MGDIATRKIAAHTSDYGTIFLFIVAGEALVSSEAPTQCKKSQGNLLQDIELVRTR